MTADDENSYDVSTSGIPPFTGKPEEVERVLMHVQLKKLLDSDIRTREDCRCAYLATSFKGKVVDAFIQQLRGEPRMLTKYEVLTTWLKETYGWTDELRTAQAQQRLIHLRHITTVAEFAAEFEALSDELEWPETARSAFFFKALKADIRDKLIVSNPADYTQMKNEAKRLETMTQVADTSTTTSGSSKRRHKKKKGKKCEKCGRTNHATKDCFAKTAVNMIYTSLDRVPREGTSNEIMVDLDGRKVLALVDSGASVNCARPEALPGKQGVQFDGAVYGPTGASLADRPLEVEAYVQEENHTMLLIPGLTYELILGRPWIEGQRYGDPLKIEITRQPDNPGGTRPLSPREDQALEQYLSPALEKGFIVPSTAPFASPITWVEKKTKDPQGKAELRMCVDYRKLNEVTIRDKYPLPKIADLLQKARGKTHFSKLDLENAFHHVRVETGSQPLTAFRTPRGVYEYKVVPFGLTNAPAVFQRYIDQVTRNFEGEVLVYLDDLLVATDSMARCLEVTTELESVLRRHGLKLNERKCVRHVRSVDYLGFHLSQGEITPTFHWEGIDRWPVPRNKTQLQAFLGHANFIREHIPYLSYDVSPLTPLTGNKDWEWGPEQQEALERTFAAMKNALRLCTFNQEEETSLYTDASGVGIGGILMQKGKVVAVTSRQLTPAEQNYTTTEREVLAVVFTVSRYRVYLEGTRSRVTVFTDHLAITQTLNRRDENRRINRWAAALSPYQLNFVHVAGIDNPADVLTRRPDYRTL